LGFAVHLCPLVQLLEQFFTVVFELFGPLLELDDLRLFAMDALDLLLDLLRHLSFPLSFLRV
jgi:hypothetical protein